MLKKAAVAVQNSSRKPRDVLKNRVKGHYTIQKNPSPKTLSPFLGIIFLFKNTKTPKNAI